jgi:hypothetical protein
MTAIDEQHWAREFLAKINSSRKAPNPSSYPEPPHLSNSYWIREFPIEYEDDWVKAPAPDTVDVAIIGSGITGATVAYQLAESRPELKVALFEARGLCTGATGRNGGHIGRPDAHGVRDLAAQFGVEEALRIRRFNRMNRELMLETIEKLDAAEEVDLSVKGTLIVFEDEGERETYLKDEEFAREHGAELEGFVVDKKWVLKVCSANASEQNSIKPLVDRLLLAMLTDCCLEGQHRTITGAVRRRLYREIRHNLPPKVRCPASTQSP